MTGGEDLDPRRTAADPHAMRAAETLYARLSALDVRYQRCDHPAVFTCEESERLVPRLPGAKTKNLFVRDKKGRRHLLVVVPQDKRVDLRALAQVLDAKGLSLASDERLREHLGITPGAVSILAVVNDAAGSVEVVVDRAIWSAEAIQAHPLVNTATLVLPRVDLERLLRQTGHPPTVIDVPETP